MSHFNSFFTFQLNEIDSTVNQMTYFDLLWCSKGIFDTADTDWKVKSRQTARAIVEHLKKGSAKNIMAPLKKLSSPRIWNELTRINGTESRRCLRKANLELKVFVFFKSNF